MGEGDLASMHLLDFRRPQLNAREVCRAVVSQGSVSGCGDSLVALWELTIVFFVTQGPEGVQLAHDRQGLCKDRWVLDADPVYVEVGMSV